MVTPFLSINTRNGPPQVSQYTNASPTLLGNPLGGSADINSGYPGGTQFAFMSRSGALNYEGEQNFIAEAGGNIWRSLDGGNSWNNVHALTNLSSTIQSSTTGLWIQTGQGQSKISICYLSNSSTQWYASSSLNGGLLWNAVGPFTSALSTNSSPICDIAVHRGKVYFQTSDVTGSGHGVTGIYDPNQNSISGWITKAESTNCAVVGKFPFSEAMMPN